MIKPLAFALAILASPAFAQGYGDPYGPRRAPRFERPYDYDRPPRQFEDRDWIHPDQRHFEQGYRQYDRLERGAWGRYPTRPW
jgi:hypothetical protein